MSNELYQDVFEPEEMAQLLKQVLGDKLIVSSINSLGMADYFWIDQAGVKRQKERKQIAELLSDIDAVEVQLNEEMRTCDELTLIVQGVWVPTPDGVQTYQQSKDGRYFTPSHAFTRQPGLVQKYLGWKWVLQHSVGIIVEEVATLGVLAHTLVADYRASMKPEHTTMRRYVVPHMSPFDRNPHIDNLCRLRRDMSLGPETATKLIGAFGTFWRAVSAPYGDLVLAVGSSTADKILAGIGRPIEEKGTWA